MASAGIAAAKTSAPAFLEKLVSVTDVWFENLKNILNYILNCPSLNTLEVASTHLKWICLKQYRDQLDVTKVVG